MGRLDPASYPELEDQGSPWEEADVGTWGNEGLGGVTRKEASADNSFGLPLGEVLFVLRARSEMWVYERKQNTKRQGRDWQRQILEPPQIRRSGNGGKFQLILQ